MTSPRRGRHDRLLVPVALVALTLLQVFVLRGVWHAGEVLGDDNSIHLAEIAALSRALAAGDFGFWVDGGNAGYPSGYYYQLLPQLAPAAVHALGGGAFGLSGVFKLFVVLSIAALPACGYLGLRWGGADRASALGAAALAGLVSSSSRWGLGIDSVFSAGLYTQAWAAALAPLFVGAAWTAALSGRYAGRAVATGAALLLSHPFWALAVVPPLAGTLLVAPRARAELFGRLARLAALAAAIAAVTAWFWLPALVHYDSFGGFPRRVPGEEGLPLAAFARFVFSGDLLDRHRLPVLSLLALGAVAAAVRWRGGPTRLLLASAAFFAALVVLGPTIGKTKDDLIPAIRFLGPLQLCLALAAGAALGQLVARQPDPAWRRGGAAVVALVATLLAVRHPSADLADTVARYPKIRRDELQQIFAHLAASPRGRLFADAVLGTGPHYFMYLPEAYAEQPALRSHGGAALQSSPNYATLIAGDPARLLELFGVRWVLATHEARVSPSLGRPALMTPHYVLLERPEAGLFAAVPTRGALPRAREARQDAVLAWLRGPPGQPHLVDPPAAQHDGTAEILAVRTAPSRYAADVRVTSAGPAALMARVSWHPGWRARVDGQPAPTLRLAPDFLGVVVPPGEHTVDFRFSRPAWSWGLFFLALAGSAGAAVIAWRRRRARLAPVA